MLILIEGADGSGKSTLVDKLSTIGYQTICIRDRTDDVYIKYLEQITLSEHGRCPIICDRSFITDWVYRLIDGGKPNTSIFCMTQLLQHCKIIYCETETAYDDARMRGEDNIINRYHHEQLCKQYKSILRQLTLFEKTPIIYYDWQNDDIQKVIDFIGYKPKLKGGKNGIR